VPQCYHRIDFHGAASGNIAGEGGGHDEKTNDATVSDGVSGADAVKHGGKHAGETNRTEDSHSHARHDEGEALAKNHSKHLETLRAERHPNPDLVGSLGSHVGQYAIETDHGEDESGPGENPQHHHAEAAIV